MSPQRTKQRWLPRTSACPQSAPGWSGPACPGEGASSQPARWPGGLRRQHQPQALNCLPPSLIMLKKKNIRNLKKKERKQTKNIHESQFPDSPRKLRRLNILSGKKKVIQTARKSRKDSKSHTSKGSLKTAAWVSLANFLLRRPADK